MTIIPRTLLGVVLAGSLLVAAPAVAHRSGCHRWHSCPSDHGRTTTTARMGSLGPTRKVRNRPQHQYLFRLRFRPPYEWEGMLAFLAARATPGVEDVKDGVYRRTISLNGSNGQFEVMLDAQREGLEVRVQFGDVRSLFFIIERIRGMFDLNADWTAIVKSLRSDPGLAARMQARPGLRVPGCWNGFELATRAILGQQVSVKAATTMAGRIAMTFGQPLPAGNGLTHLFPSPEVLAAADLTGIGLTRARAATIRNLARAVCDGHIRFEKMVDLDDFLRRICQVPGIGKWTAQYIAMRALGEPDAFPSGDLGLLRALDLESTRELEHRAESWRPWRSYAAMYLWNVPGPSVRHRSALSRSTNDRRVEELARAASSQISCE